MKYFFIFILFFTFFFTITIPVSAHSPGSLPFITISGSYTQSNPYFQGYFSPLTIPEEITRGMYTINHPIHFQIDRTKFPVSAAGTFQFRWYYTKGNTFTDIASPITQGDSVDFTFPEKRTYFVILQAKTPTDTEYTTFDVIQIHTIQNASYMPPSPKIQITADSFDTNSPITFTASSLHDASAKHTTYLWDFGDGKIKEGEKVIYTFTEKNFDGVIYVRTIDSNGYSNDKGFSALGENGMIVFENFPQVSESVFTIDHTKQTAKKYDLLLYGSLIIFICIVIAFSLKIKIKKK